MANELRDPQDYRFGTLSAAAASSDTSISSTGFATLPTNYTTGRYLPLVLHDPATGVREVVWVTAHTASSNNVTVVRGKEGTSAAAWPSGTQWVCAPTAARDCLAVSTRAALPTDRHVGFRVNVSDESGVVVEYTPTGSWQPSVGVANPADIGTKLAGGSVPAGSVVLLRTGSKAGSTNASGEITETFPVAFPNGFVMATMTSKDALVIPKSTSSATQLVVACYSSAGALAGAGVSVTFYYVAVGY